MFIMIFGVDLSTLGDISNVLLGASSVLTAIFTAFALLKQYRLQKDTFIIDKSAKQPVFNITFDYIDADNDNKYEDVILQIYNEGYIVKQINSIKVTTIFDVSERSNHKLFMIIGYFCRSTRYQSLNGLMYKSRGNNNHAKFMNIYLDVLDLYKIYHRYVEISVDHMIKIEYTDIYGENNVCYFKGRSIIGEEIYNSIFKQICNQHDPLDIDKVTTSELIPDISPTN